jgi:hypothetical protein
VEDGDVQENAMKTLAFEAGQRQRQKERQATVGST